MTGSHFAGYERNHERPTTHEDFLRPGPDYEYVELDVDALIAGA